MYELGQDEIDAVADVLSRCRLFRYMDDATEVRAFERELATRMATSHALLTTSGTGALICGLAAVGVGPGDEVLLPAYGFIADPLAVLAVGAVPVVCEVDETLGIDPEDMAGKLTDRTRAVLPVHMNGFAADMDGVLDLAARHDLRVVEDACQAIGGTHRGRLLGTLGDVGAFSFNFAKLLTAGEGGALITDDPDLFERAFVTHDGSCMFDGKELTGPAFAGLAFRANEVSAAILRVQLRRLDGILERLRATTRRLREAVEPVPGAVPVEGHDPEGACGSHLAYRFDDGVAARGFVDRVNQGGDDFYAFQPMAAGHSFFEWEIVHQRRGGHHPGRNPLADTRWHQGPEDLPRSRGIFERTVLVAHGLDPDGDAVADLRRAAHDGGG